MDFSYPPSAERMRRELRAWLDDNAPADLRAMSGGLDLDATTLERLREWNRVLADAHWAAIAWPAEYGGRDAGLIEQVVLAEEMDRARAPGPVNVIGIANIAPAIMEHGTEEQRRAHLGPMLRGDQIWCQGFSEPDAGSDLASLTTSAERRDDTWIVNGQKTWNSLGVHADWCELLVRTDRDAPKHRGITCLAVNMSSPGIEVRPIETITGEREFADIYLTDVEVPVANTLGPVNEGWRVAMTTLTHERAGVATLHLALRRQVAELVERARSAPAGADRVAADDPVLRRRLARVHLEAELLKLLSDRAISGQLHGRAAGPEGSLAKLHWSETSQRLAELAADIEGPAGLRGESARRRAASRSLTIAGGTTQVNKNVIATRILGLPRG